MKTSLIVVLTAMLALICADRGQFNGHAKPIQPQDLKQLTTIIQKNATLNAPLIESVSGDTTLAALYLTTLSNGTKTINNYVNLFGCSNFATSALANYFTQNINPVYPGLAAEISSDLTVISAFNTLLTSDQTVMNHLVGEFLVRKYASYVSGCVTLGSSSLSVNITAVRQDDTEAFAYLNLFYSIQTKTEFLCHGRRVGRN